MPNSHAGDETPWDAIFRGKSPDQVYDLGARAYLRNLPDIAARAMRAAANRGHVEAAYQLGLIEAKHGDLVEATRWLRQAADGGHLKATNDLGAALVEAGEPAEGLDWIRRGAMAGDPDGMYNLGILLVHRGEIVEATKWLRSALQTGRADAAGPLRLLRVTYELWQAASRLRRAGLTIVPRLVTSDAAAVQYLIGNREAQWAALRYVYTVGDPTLLIVAHLLLAAAFNADGGPGRRSARPSDPCDITAFMEGADRPASEAVAHALAAALIAMLVRSPLLPEATRQLGSATPFRKLSVQPGRLLDEVCRQLGHDAATWFAEGLRRLPGAPIDYDAVLATLLNDALAAPADDDTWLPG